MDKNVRLAGSVTRDELNQFLTDKLQISKMSDYCPNGLQVEGVAQIKVIVSGVTASLALIEAAIALKADALLVHHGYFWRGESPCLVGQKYKRIKKLLDANMNLFAVHLPLDVHPEWGNNVQLARRLGLVIDGTFAEQGIAYVGRAIDSGLSTVGDLSRLIESQLGRAPLVIGSLDQPLGRIAWCTGGAQTYFADAIDVGATVYLSGEISESTVHLARESGVAYLACGHHATERYGVQALGQAIAEHFGVVHHFVDIPNPV